MYPGVPRRTPGSVDEARIATAPIGGRRRFLLGKAEVENLHPSVARDEDVLGLQIAVHDAALVRGGQPARDLNRVVDRLERREPFRLLEADAQRVAFEQLHDRVDDAGIVADVVQRQNVGMVERGDRLRFALEARQQVRHHVARPREAP